MNWKDTLRAIAPTVATVLGGPVAGLAVEGISKALGIDPDQVKATIERGHLNGDQIAALKQAELDLQKRLAELDIDLAKIDAGDRDSARQREMTVRDRVPGLLAAGVTLGFFGVLAWLLAFGVPLHGGEALLVMLGSLGTAWASIVAYYFGSSAGSRAKTDHLAGLAKG